MCRFIKNHFGAVIPLSDLGGTRIKVGRTKAVITAMQSEDESLD